MALASLASERPRATFTENKGQWPEQVLYRSLFPGGALFVEKNAFTYLLYQGGSLAHHGHDHAEPEVPFKAHAYRVKFEGAQSAMGQGRQSQPGYENFFLGADPGSWGTHCGVFGEVVLRDLYPGIDLRIDGREGLKYEFVVAPGADPSSIRMRYEGQEAIKLVDGRVEVVTSAGNVQEEAPVSWQHFFDGISNHHIPVPSAYRLHDATLSFDVRTTGELPLIIDPELTFGSYSGSAADNFGFTATYDDDGNLYGGGIVFGLGYPTTLGVLDDSFNGGTIDIGISKWTSDGTDLVWSTYIGGFNGNESPHSLVVNSADELFVLASTGSSDFPVTGGAYATAFAGGPSMAFGVGYGYSHSFGTDIAVAHLNATATALLGSTFLGGSGNDGLNLSPSLVWNYGDSFRGEIALDADEHPVVSTSTASNDIPIVNGSQTSYGGGTQDAYFFRMNPGLTALEWATYHGGSGDDSGYGVQFNSLGEDYFTGGTNSDDLPMQGSPFLGTSPGGIDGYIARYSTSGIYLSSTFIGTSAYDQSYFVQIDLSNAVYVVGQTHGAYPVTPGKYSNSGSSQFIHKFQPDLTTSLWSTVVGNGSNTQDVSPTAFLVSDCGQIYFCGWAGNTNTFAQADQSTISGMPLTTDAFQTTNNGSDFYLMVLAPDAAGLHYATYFGGGTSNEHVDGGTSRFDKAGNVYQAVCAGCGSYDDFPTTPDAWSTTNNSFNCNLGVFKFNLTLPSADIGIAGPNEVCAPAEVQFTNTSSGGTTYSWTFGDGGSSDEFAPLHLYADTGVYTVTMLLTDSNGCVLGDSTDIDVFVYLPDDSNIDPIDPICIGGSVQLHASGGSSYVWSPVDDLSDPNIADPVADPLTTTEYTVVVTDVCGDDTLSITVEVGEVNGLASRDTTICIGDTTVISATGGGTYQWTPAASLSSATDAAPLAFPQATTSYVVLITSPEGCINDDTVLVTVISDPPTALTDDVAVCLGDSVQLVASGGVQYVWEAAAGLSATDVADPMVLPTTSAWYHVDVINACGTVHDSVFVDVQHVEADAWPDTIVCPGTPVQLHATGGTLYAWSPPDGLSSTSDAHVMSSVMARTTYAVQVSNALGCSDSAAVVVDVFPAPLLWVTPDVVIDFGDFASLTATGQGSITWSPSTWLSCDTCLTTIARPENSMEYFVTLVDSNGCKAVEPVMVLVNGTLFVPNTFSPNGDGINDGFKPIVSAARALSFDVFNRWGEQIYHGATTNAVWDGTYHGVDSPIDTYVWRADITELGGNKRTVYGHVNLVR